MTLRALPKVDKVALDPRLASLCERLGARVVTAVARSVIADAREQVKAGSTAPSLADVVEETRERAEKRLSQEVVPVINATGVLLHTNLGRAPLSADSLQRIVDVAGQYSTLEIDPELGVRTRRALGVESRLARLAGAEDALIVNNNAAAVLLCLSGLAAGREVIVSRGELVEIGGGFRIPEVLARSGARLVEVGTTNRTRAADYEAAISDATAALLRVHPSNFSISGFAERPKLGELCRLARSKQVPLIKDLGGGLLVELPAGISAADRAREPTVQSCVHSGADLTCFSLDKLFGGPQAGAIVGTSALVQRLRQDPLARALRIDKVVIAALEPMLRAYERGDLNAIRLQRMLHAPVAELRLRVQGWHAAISTLHPVAAVVDSAAAIGGGTLADATVPSVALALCPDDPDALSKRLRLAQPAVFARIDQGRVLLDARTVLPEQDATLGAVLQKCLAP
ncbi:MAG TPA: L-seryl-tRNA(Sec) selenium transferase [Polyangiaceae bacterium]|nr:L-seryl-tRNA(Sec) selenium transferase [Polyangiaceae bacterium]